MVVIGFDLNWRSWITQIEDTSEAILAEDFPDMKGELLTEELRIDYAKGDFGGIVKRSAIAVLLPASTDDIVKLVRFARQHNIKIAPRGSGHSC
ncbi:FAD-binding protein, partial [Anaplasma marginale]|uniref:FAD-binding protein n=1 Tax=Anaplasma marginale TaxID=770 RepID=UPI0005B2EC5E